MSGPSLLLGDVELCGTDQTLGYWFEVLAEDTDLGNPAPVEVVIESFLADGAIASSTRHDNRELKLKVRVQGSDLANLAAGETALLAQLGRRNTLVWTPPGRFAAKCVFDVSTSSMAFNFDDLEELENRRTYTLTLRALPFARTAYPVEVTTGITGATPPAPTDVLVDDCSSTTGWSGGPATAGAISTDGSVVYSGYVRPGAWAWLQRSGLALDMTATPYLRVVVDVNVNQVTGLELRVYSGGAGGVYKDLQPVAVSDRTRWYKSPFPVISAIRFLETSKRPAGAMDPNFKFFVAEISRRNYVQTVPVVGSEGFALVPVKGSARAPGSLQVASTDGNGLGDVLVYTRASQDVTQPPLQAWRTAGPAAAADAAALRGSSTDLTTQHYFDIPAAGFTPGGHVLLARVKHLTAAGTYTATWTADSMMSATDPPTGPGGAGTVLPGGQGGTVNIGIGAADTYQVAMLGAMSLPSHQMGANGRVHIGLIAPGLVLDEAWLFNLTDGRLTWVQCGVGAAGPGGGNSSRLWLDAPSLDNPIASVMRGVAEDRSDAWAPSNSLKSLGQHEFVPPALNAYLISTGAPASLTAYYYPRFHTHVVDVPESVGGS